MMAVVVHAASVDAIAPAPCGPLKIVALGTSLTARGGWTRPLGAELGRRLRRRVDIVTVARPGATSRWGAEQLDRVAGERPDLVLVEFSANDAALRRLVTPRESRSNLRRILLGLRARLAHARLIVMAMNPASGLRGLVRPLLDRYADAHLREASGLGFETLDTRPIWSAMTAAERAAAIPDGLHPLPSAAASVMVPALGSLVAQSAGKDCAR